LLLLRKQVFKLNFSQVSLGYRHLGVNTQAQTRGEKKERKKSRGVGRWGVAQPAVRILKFG
jgi:hypothetical protein